MSLFDVIAFLLTLLGLCYYFIRKSYKYWEVRKVPHDPPKFPFGSLQNVAVTKNLGEILKDKYNEAKDLPFYGLTFYITPMLLIRDPQLIKQILIKDFSSFHDRGFHFSENRDPLLQHLFFLRGQTWRNLRIKLGPTFTSGKMKMMFSTMRTSSEELMSHLAEPAKKGEIIEVKEVFAKFTRNVIARCAFGLELDSFKNSDSEFVTLSQFLFKPSAIRGFFNTIFFSLAKFAYLIPVNIVPSKVTKFFTSVVRDTMNRRESENIKRHDFMQLLIELKNKGFVEDVDQKNSNNSKKLGEEIKFTPEIASAQAFLFFVAGFETSSTTLQFCLYEIAKNDAVQRKVMEENDKVLKKYDGIVTYEALQELVYLDKVISETLRKYPAAPFIIRECTQNYTISGHDKMIIEKGTRVVVSLLGLQNDPKYFPEPEKFDPDRFSAENKSQIEPFAYLPFGEGPRICIGERFAQLQMKTSLAQFFQRYQVEICDESPKKIQFDPRVLLTGLKGQMLLRIRNRDQ